MNKSILVADDDPMIRSLLRVILETANYTVFEAQNGTEAVEKAKQIQPDVLILNIQMPQMDGITVCQTLRREETTAVLPIVILSGQAHITAVNRGLLAGANRYMIKPMTPSALLKNVYEMLGNNPTPPLPN